MSAALRASLRTLADARANQLAIDEEVRRLRAEFDATHHALLANQRDGKAIIDTVEGQVRALALAAHATTGEKAPAPGVEIKATKVYAIDEAAGFAWAKQTGLCLIPESLDKAALKKIATATPLPFVVITDEPKAFIATQINAALLVEVDA